MTAHNKTPSCFIITLFSYFHFILVLLQPFSRSVVSLFLYYCEFYSNNFKKQYDLSLALILHCATVIKYNYNSSRSDRLLIAFKCQRI